jgi:hypothetical protein
VRKEKENTKISKLIWFNGKMQRGSESDIEMKKAASI